MARYRVSNMEVGDAPTRSEFAELLRKSGGSHLKGLRDESTGTAYLWDPGIATHDEMMRALYLDTQSEGPITKLNNITHYDQLR